MLTFFESTSISLVELTVFQYLQTETRVVCEAEYDWSDQMTKRTTSSNEFTALMRRVVAGGTG